MLVPAADTSHGVRQEQRRAIRGPSSQTSLASRGIPAHFHPTPVFESVSITRLGETHFPTVPQPPSSTCKDSKDRLGSTSLVSGLGTLPSGGRAGQRDVL